MNLDVIKDLQRNYLIGVLLIPVVPGTQVFAKLGVVGKDKSIN
jgi:hypothetical protein